ncbi:MAG: selenocysteine-specific translation elongation factor [Actinomycetota bacterium]|nr:selenocysteine-specific translation elongation factor [Actinomycetota bacterium]
MHVLATAGHVDHGKSTLVRALTGMEPDRWAEERRRGMTIDLGFAWTSLPTGETVAFVDVPGHERFVGNMLAGVGSVPAVLFVVAADEGWEAQSGEHLDALNALGVGHGLLVITRVDLEEPDTALELAMGEFAGTSLADLPWVAVSARTGTGLDELRVALHALLSELPEPDTGADVRLWVDRAFTIRGAGTVVTGTLSGGTLSVGDTLTLHPSGASVTVRGLQSLGQAQGTVEATARVAVNLRGVALDEVSRGDALVSPERWLTTRVVDVAIRPMGGPLPSEAAMHIGSAGVPVRTRMLGQSNARLALAAPLPLRIGDVAVLRDPGRRRIAAGITILDIRPPSLSRRGDAERRRSALAQQDGRPDGAAELRRRGILAVPELVAMGAVPPHAPLVGDWLVDEQLRKDLAFRADTVARAYVLSHPLEPGIPLEMMRRQLTLPDNRLLMAILPPTLVVDQGRVRAAEDSTELPEDVQGAVDVIRAELADDPFAAPSGVRLAELGLDRRRLAAAVRSGALLKIAEGIFLLPGADAGAAERLAALAQPFTASDARTTLGTTRRVIIPLLEWLEQHRFTRRTSGGDHEIVDSGFTFSAPTWPGTDE